MKNKVGYRRFLILPLLLFSLVSCTVRHEPDRKNGQEDPKPTHTVLPGDGDTLYDSLHDSPADSVRIFPDITHDRVKELIRAVIPPERYCWYYTSVLYSTDGSLSRKGILIYDNGDYKNELYDGEDTLIKTVSLRDGELFVAQNGIETALSADSTTFFAESGISETASFLSEEGEEFSYTLAESDYGTLLYADFTVEKGAYRQRQEYYISLDYGMVVRADCYENDSLIYHLETNALYELSDSVEQAEMYAALS